MTYLSHRAALKAGAARGLMSIRADAGAPSTTEIAGLIREVNTTFAAMKASHEQQIAELKSGKAVDLKSLADDLDRVLGAPQK